MTLTAPQLSACTGCTSAHTASIFLPHLEEAMRLFGIDTLQRRAMFFANIGHETGGLRWLTELWGPTDQQKKYDPPHDLARRLGNANPGDGKRYRGRGLFQTTGAYNTARVRDRLRAKFPGRAVPDFLAEPEKLAEPEWAALSAADFWDDHDLSTWADMNSFDGVCDMINKGRKTVEEGDTNGFADRLRLYRAALKVLE